MKSAWSSIKSTAAEQRQLWRDIDEALRYGRSLHRADRADAMWLAENWNEVQNSIAPDLCHPHRIRSAFSAVQADTPPAPELTIESPSRLTASIEQVASQAAKLNKLNATGVAGLHGRARGRTEAEDSAKAPPLNWLNRRLRRYPQASLSTSLFGVIASKTLLATF